MTDKRMFLIVAFLFGLVKCMEVPLNTGKKVFLLFGPTRAGKSTFINKLYGSEVVAVGDPNGANSTTMYCREVVIKRPDFFNDQRVSIIDVQGLGDTGLTQDEEIVDSIREFLMNVLINNGVAQLDGIIMFNSLRTNCNVGRMIAYLQEMFSHEVTQSIFVLATKADELRSNPTSAASKIQGIQLMCDDKGIPWKVWNNYDGIKRGPNGRENIELPDNVLDQNISDLYHSLADLKPYDLSGIQEALDEIELMALEMFRNQPWNQVVQQVEIENDVLQEYYAEIDRVRYIPESGSSRPEDLIAARAREIQSAIGEVQGSELRTIKVPKEIVYHEIVTRKVAVTVSKRRGGLSGFFGGTKDHTTWVDTKDVEFRTRVEDVEVQLLQPVLKLLDLNQCMFMARQETTFREESYVEKESKVRVAKDKTKVPITIDVPESSLEACRRNALKMKREEPRNSNSFHNLFSRRNQANQ